MTTEENHMTHTPAPALTAVLDELDELRAKATPGEWREGYGDVRPAVGPMLLGPAVASPSDPADAALIVAAVNRLPELTAALRAVLAKHRPVEWQECGEDGVPDLDKPLPSFCAECTDDEWTDAVEFGDTIDAAADVTAWPCPTVAAITTALEAS